MELSASEFLNPGMISYKFALNYYMMPRILLLGVPGVENNITYHNITSNDDRSKHQIMRGNSGT